MNNEARSESENRRRWREARFERRRRSSAWLVDRAISESGGTGPGKPFAQPPRPARCGWPLGVTRVRVRGGRAFVSGLEHCASPWCCPVCTPVIRAERAGELRAIMERWTSRPPHSLAFATLTVPHEAGDPLDGLVGLVSRSWSRMRKTRGWDPLRQAGRIAHYARAMEATWGARHGWHVHLHVLLFLETPADPSLLQDAMLPLWAGAVGSLDPARGKPSKKRGVLVETVASSPERLAGYMSKPPDHAGMASEITRADAKNARAGGLSPFQLLDPPVIASLGPGRARALWLEYVDATYRKRSITWSRRLREEYGTGPERTDEQIIARAMPGEEAIALDPAEYQRLAANPNILSHVLAKTETGEIPLAETLIQAALQH